MDHHERPLPSSPTLHAVEEHRYTPDSDVISSKLPLEESGEKVPLLGSRYVEVVGKDSGRLLNKAKRQRLDWKSLTLVTVLWFGTLFISAAYSMIAPFFPQEVYTMNILC